MWRCANMRVYTQTDTDTDTDTDSDSDTDTDSDSDTDTDTDTDTPSDAHTHPSDTHTAVKSTARVGVESHTWQVPGSQKHLSAHGSHSAVPAMHPCSSPRRFSVKSRASVARGPKLFKAEGKG
eukprot:1519794-Rhodomonas_salina.1